MKQYGGQKGFGLVTLLLAVVIAGLLYVCVLKQYLRPPAAKLDGDTQKLLAVQGMNAQSMPGTVQKAQAAVDKANDILQQKDRDARALLNDGQAGAEVQQQ
jgi:type II secretory pathway pseudopilin PulG